MDVDVEDVNLDCWLAWDDHVRRVFDPSDELCLTDPSSKTGFQLDQGSQASCIRRSLEELADICGFEGAGFRIPPARIVGLI